MVSAFTSEPEGQMAGPAVQKVPAGKSMWLWIVFFLGVGVLLLLERLPLGIRFAGVASMLVCAFPVWWKRQIPGALLASLGVVGAWVTIGSYPAAMGFFPRWIWVALLPLFVFLPWFVRPPKPRPPAWVHFFPVALALWTALTPPARRYHVGQTHPAVAEAANELRTLEEAVAFVHTNIQRKKGPPTDTAVDTLRRGHAHCGGMSALLHALLGQMGFESRIVHARGEAPGHIHTLVEVRRDGETFLADPQENVVFPGRIEMLLVSTPDPAWPDAWRGMRKTYRHLPGHGYRPAMRESD